MKNNLYKIQLLKENVELKNKEFEVADEDIFKMHFGVSAHVFGQVNARINFSEKIIKLYSKLRTENGKLLSYYIWEYNFINKEFNLKSKENLTSPFVDSILEQATKEMINYLKNSDKVPLPLHFALNHDEEPMTFKEFYNFLKEEEENISIEHTANWHWIIDHPNRGQVIKKNEEHGFERIIESIDIHFNELTVEDWALNVEHEKILVDVIELAYDYFEFDESGMPAEEQPVKTGKFELHPKTGKLKMLRYSNGKPDLNIMVFLDRMIPKLFWENEVPNYEKETGEKIQRTK